MIRIQIIILLILMVVAVISTSFVKHHRTLFNKKKFKNTLIKENSKKKITPTQAPLCLSDLLSDDIDIDLAGANILWQKTLFMPDRIETSVIDPSKAIKKKQGTYSFELVGIGKVGDISCAIILVNESLRSRRGRGRRKKKTQVKKVKHVYKLGKLVGKSGYTLSVIDLESVTLTKGIEKLILSLDKTDSASQNRKKIASKEALKTIKKPIKKKMKPKQPIKKKVKNNLRPPPPPPPPPGVNLPSMPSIKNSPAPFRRN